MKILILKNLASIFDKKINENSLTNKNQQHFLNKINNF